jgi:hypothetical protein
MRAISTVGLTDCPKSSSGATPLLQWVAIRDLIVNGSYQRDMSPKSRRNITRIAENFRWTFFAPVVVAPVEDGKFAIIDGQHRTTAAALCGIESVPCQIVVAEECEQAAAFKAINADTTPVSPVALYAAALAAGEAWAVELDHVCACADVELLRVLPKGGRLKPGQTVAVSALRRCLRRYGRDTLITALQCVTQTTNNAPALLTRTPIEAICRALTEVPEWRDSGLRLLAAFDGIDLAGLHRAVRREEPGRPAGEALSQAIIAALCKDFLPLAAE